MAFNIDDPLASLGLGGIKEGVADIALYVVWGLIFLAVGFFIWKTYQDKKIYIYPVRIHRQRNNGQVKEFNTFGGYIKKGDLTYFLIKMTKFKKKEANCLPDSSLMDEDNRVYYWQLSPDDPLIQVKRSFYVEKVFAPNKDFIEPTLESKNNSIKTLYEQMLSEEEFKGKTEEEMYSIATSLYNDDLENKRNIVTDITVPTYTPVRSDLKQRALADINNYKNSLGVDVNKQFAYFVIGVIALVIIGVVVFYIAINKGDIPILTECLPLLFLRKKHK